MSKTAITICGEECVILPAPKGAFLVKDGLQYPYFVEYAAIAIDGRVYPNIYGMELSENESYLSISDDRERNLAVEVTAPMLQKFLDIEIEQDGDPRAHIIFCITNSNNTTHQWSMVRSYGSGRNSRSITSPRLTSMCSHRYGRVYETIYPYRLYGFYVYTGNDTRT